MYNSPCKKLFITFAIFISSIASGTTYYVSSTGSSSGIGTISNPYDFTTGNGKAITGGDSLIIRGGSYNFTTPQKFKNSGSIGMYIQIVAYPGEIPIFDFRRQVYNSGSQGVVLSGNYVHLKGIIMQGAGDNGLQVTGSNNLIEHCTTRWNCDSGTQMKGGSNNYLLNCDSYENFDYESGGIATPDFGGNADGFADKQYTNTGTNTYKGCRSWRNGDDGWDSFEKVGNTVYDSCWCYDMAPATFDMTDNIRFKTDSATWFYQFKNAAGRYVMKNYGNGNGFKLGGNNTSNNATLHNCISVANKVKGFDQNNNAGLMTIYNCTSYNNGSNFGFSNSSYGTLIIKNCASLLSKGSNNFSSKSVTQAFNSWNTGFSCVAGDFVSLDDTQMLNDRQPDGSLPEITLLYLTPTSGLIDKGTNVGFPYYGTAPDLGAYEYNPNTTSVPDIQPNGITMYYSSPNREIIIRGSIESVEIYELNGIKIYAQRVTSESDSFSSANLPKGISLIRVISKNGETSTRKVLIN